MITGKDLISWGFTPGPWFKDAIAEANRLVVETGMSDREITNKLSMFAPKPVDYLKRRDRAEVGFFLNLDAVTSAELDNARSVGEHMVELMRVPTIKAGAVMPDACPAGSAKGTIPVGGVVACENAIHPGFHSSDVCCSMAITVLGSVDPKNVLDTSMKITHFGPGGRNDYQPGAGMNPSLRLRIADNPITAPLTKYATSHFMTQGDGNHFFYVGRLKSTGQTAIVTHHGSRGFGARVYKAGMRIAEAMTRKIATGIPKHQVWITADTQEGRDYWEALQICRQWTKENHFAIHDRVADTLRLKPLDRFWNEHNFVFQKPDGLFYHAKGATPAFPNFSPDAMGPSALTLIPMNMAEPILITRGLNAVNGLGFSPHGAGRNFSRTQFKNSLVDPFVNAQIHAQQLGLSPDLDARWFSGKPDVSEMPGAYKNAASVRTQIAQYGLAEIVDEVEPYGCIMAGEIDWKRAGKELGDMA